MISSVNKNCSKVIAVTGGKGGIGKTSIAVNLSIALAHYSQKVMLLDADLGLANVDVLLNLQPKKNLQHVLANLCSLDEVIISGPRNISIVPACSGNLHMAKCGFNEVSGLMQLFSQLEFTPNILVIDTSAGITENVIGLSCASDEVIIILCNEPPAITDAYALIKVLNTEYKIHKFRIITNKVNSIGESQELFAKLTRVTDKFLNVGLLLTGHIPEDKFMGRAVCRQRAVIECYPHSASSKAIFDIARKVISWPQRSRLSGGINFFQGSLMNGCTGT
jgi:flagellar biosynthesis protein FlhG